jgi:hypothetical protein
MNHCLNCVNYKKKQVKINILEIFYLKLVAKVLESAGKTCATEWRTGEKGKGVLPHGLSLYREANHD